MSADQLGDPAVPLWITEGVKKADCGALHGLCIVALSGVWNWLRHQHRRRQDGASRTGTTSPSTVVASILAFDGDVARKESVQKALTRPGRLPGDQGCPGRVPAPARHRRQDRPRRLPRGRAHRRRPVAAGQADSPPPSATRRRYREHRHRAEPEPAASATCLTQATRTTCSSAGSATTTTSTRSTPCSPPPRSNGSTATRCGCWSSPVPATPRPRPCRRSTASAPSSPAPSPREGALLSATPKRERAKDATGGLLRKIGDRGRARHQGRDLDPVDEPRRPRPGARRAARGLRRPLGPQRRHRRRPHPRLGGPHRRHRRRHHRLGHARTTSSPRWATGSCWCAWTPPTAGTPPAARPSATPATRQQMRAELAAAVAGVLAGMNTDADHRSPTTRPSVLLAAADLVTLARTGVEYDYRGDVIDAHAPEMPTRFAKQLAQIVRGARRDRHGPRTRRCGWRSAAPATRCRRCGWRSSTTSPQHPAAARPEVRKRLDKPRATVDRQLQALHMLGVLTVRRGAIRREPTNTLVSTRWPTASTRQR